MKESLFTLWEHVNAFAFTISAIAVSRLDTWMLDFLAYHWYSRYMLVKASGIDREIYLSTVEMRNSCDMSTWYSKMVAKECDRWMLHDMKRSVHIV